MNEKQTLNSVLNSVNRPVWSEHYFAEQTLTICVERLMPRLSNMLGIDYWRHTLTVTDKDGKTIFEKSFRSFPATRANRLERSVRESFNHIN